MQNNYSDISPSRASIVYGLLGNSIYSKNIIEFGASSGETLKELKNDYDCQVEAFDLFPVKLDFCESSYFDLDELNFLKLEQKIKKCDIILFLDVLEHVKSPQQIISQLLDINPHLTIILISPNFSSVRMLWAWLNGHLPDNKSGYYDSTHIKWLSENWVKYNFENSSFQIHNFSIFSKKIGYRLIQKLAPSRLCSQFGAVIRKRT